MKYFRYFRLGICNATSLKWTIYLTYILIPDMFIREFSIAVGMVWYGTPLVIFIVIGICKYGQYLDEKRNS